MLEDNASPSSRLKGLRASLGLTLKEFGLRMGVTSTSVQRWEAGHAEISELIARAIEQAFTIRYEWVLTGEGPMWAEKPTPKADDGEIVARPMIDGAASCGPGGEIADPGPHALMIPFRKEFLQQLLRETNGGALEEMFVVECKGESMRPTIRPGDMAITSTALLGRLQPNPSGLYLVRTDPNSADARVKRIRLENGQMWFISDSPGFKPICVNIDGVPIQSLVLGRVCWIGRSLIQEEKIESNW